MFGVQFSRKVYPNFVNHTYFLTHHSIKLNKKKSTITHLKIKKYYTIQKQNNIKYN